MTTTTTCINSTSIQLFSSSSSSSSSLISRFPVPSSRIQGASHLLSCSFSLSQMDNVGSPSLFPLHRCKTIHLVRHAQGIHNVEGDKNYKAYMSPEYFDAHITQLGWQQVDHLRKHVHSSGLIKKIDVVITSPLLRTIQTAVGVFGGEGYTDRMDVLPLMVANAGNSSRAAISSLDCPSIIAVELCREHLGVHPCDKRRSIKKPRRKLQLGNELHELVTSYLPCKNCSISSNSLFTRKEKEIAIVTHSGFLFHTLAAFGNDCHPLVKKEISSHFANCELRSMVIADRSMVGSDSSWTNYPGKIPSGIDLPSDVADEKNQEKDAPHSLQK
ncbi:UNVERIFIED_CONTAM: Phosphoglycerate mutase-like protein 1 [Sesamum angustifolium]|uniref:Phosphoglycerate mutase-like protein 1 n=1 Tax=Sesamum angustifolium TaxID=2727405 RepID=A0AAW2QBM0_9LAMI